MTEATTTLPPLSSSSDATITYDVLVVGGGVVGLAILRAATLMGWRCALVEREAELLSWASGSNSGIVCTGVDAAPGTLERALIRDAVSQIRPFCRAMNMPVRECGSLVCCWDDDDVELLDSVLEESHDAGDIHACQLEPSQIREREPVLNPACWGAVHIPGEMVVDPWLYSIALAVHARSNGADIFTEFEMDPQSSFLDSDNIWTVRRVPVDDNDTVNSDVPHSLRAHAVVNATGLWSDLLQRNIDSTSLWTAKPRRGQYRVYASSSSDVSSVLQHPIQPVPTQRTKGIFVFSTLYHQIVVGPTALDQDSRTDQTVDPVVSEQLADYAQRILPSLDTAAVVGDYVGIRPGTNQRDYQIHLQVAKRWIACAGIRSTGLTASIGLGNHVVHLLQQGLLVAPATKPTVQTTPLPPLQELVDEFHTRGDHRVTLDGHLYKVTHPITRFGWKARTGIAA